MLNPYLAGKHLPPPPPPPPPRYQRRREKEKWGWWWANGYAKNVKKNSLFLRYCSAFFNFFYLPVRIGWNKKHFKNNYKKGLENFMGFSKETRLRRGNWVMKGGLGTERRGR